MLEIKSIVTGIRNAFNMLMSRWDTSKERISELENTSTETLQNEIQREKRMRNKRNRICGEIQKGVTFT